MHLWILFACGTDTTNTDKIADTSADNTEEMVVESNALVMPYEKCSAPLDGDETYAENGQICVNVFISGASPEGTHFADYGDCDDVRTNRPTGNYPVVNTSTVEDPRLQNPQYVEDLEWVRQQQEASACVCCHDANVTDEIGMFDISSGPIWTETMSDRGLAIMSGDLDSSVLGFYAPEDNHGFIREGVGAPTTDVARWQGFFRSEMEYRGVTAEDIANMAPLGGWLLTNQTDPGRECITDFERVDRDGTIHWANSDVRYIYVMELGQDNPGLPPSFDLPEGVIWRVDVDHTAPALHTGSVQFGVVPTGSRQVFPENGSPNPLVAGQTYRLWLLTDMGLPVHTHCRFTY